MPLFGDRPEKYQKREPIKTPEDKKNYVDFADVSLDYLDTQGQYSGRFVEGMGQEYPNLGHGLRFWFRGGYDDFNLLMIHKDNVEEFIRRVKKFKETGEINA